MLAEGVERAEIARRLGVTKATVSYHARRLGAPVDQRCARRYDWKKVQAFHDAVNGARACIRAFGFSHETWHKAILRGDITPRPSFMTTDAMFAKGVRRNRTHLKQRLLQLGLRTGECERCGVLEWQGEPLSMTLHHINGDRDDHRVENLRLLCPNCHSQTDNFAGRNRPPSGTAGLGAETGQPG